jgi:hypothetical protein
MCLEYADKCRATCTGGEVPLSGSWSLYCGYVLPSEIARLQEPR